VVLDPPRSGAGSAVIDRVVGLGPTQIVYVACDPAALARDTRLLAAHGFTLTTAVPIDAFPRTHHIEVVAAFHQG
jgi:tRNA/tmRNA/rRNA uracil-C5-methylase (TrmA/RlmC/RlmD family)